MGIGAFNTQIGEWVYRPYDSTKIGIVVDRKEVEMGSTYPWAALVLTVHWQNGKIETTEAYKLFDLNSLIQEHAENMEKLLKRRSEAELALNNLNAKKI